MGTNVQHRERSYLQNEVLTKSFSKTNSLSIKFLSDAQITLIPRPLNCEASARVVLGYKMVAVCFFFVFVFVFSLLQSDLEKTCQSQ